MRKEPHVLVKIAAVVVFSTILTALALIVVGGLIWVVDTIWSAIL